MTSPLISVVLCCYNGALFLEEQLQSLFKQTYQNLEIIISDDASNDGTRAILEKYNKNERVQTFLQPHTLGAIKNVEFALQQTHGEFIAFCGQDDIWLPQKIETLYTAIKSDLLVYSDSELIDESGQSIQKKLSHLRRMYTGNDTRGFVFSNVAWGHTILINRSLLSDGLPIPPSIPHDIWFAFKAASLLRIVYVDLPLTKYRQHANSITKTIAEKRITRNDSNRYNDFKEKLYWIAVMQQHARHDEKLFYTQLYSLYKQKEKGIFQWKLGYFLLQNLGLLYRFFHKSFLSKMWDAIKQARGIRA